MNQLHATGSLPFTVIASGPFRPLKAHTHTPQQQQPWSAPSTFANPTKQSIFLCCRNSGTFPLYLFWFTLVQCQGIRCVTSTERREKKWNARPTETETAENSASVIYAIPWELLNPEPEFNGRVDRQRQSKHPQALTQHAPIDDIFSQTAVA